MAERIKMVLAVLALVAGLGGYYYLGDKSMLVRVLVLLVAVAATVVIGLQTVAGRAAREFARESLVELRKVVWPTRKETGQVTLVVVAMVVIMALFMWIVDWALLSAIKALTGQGA